MSEHLTFNAIDLAFPNGITLTAATLLDAEVQNYGVPGYTSTPEATMTYLIGLDAEIDSLYVLTKEDTGLLAAASVTHNMLDGMSHISEFAVPLDQRGNNFGRTLMGHIGAAAIQAGDQELELFTEIPGYFSSLGFITTGILHFRGKSQLHTMNAFAGVVVSTCGIS